MRWITLLSLLAVSSFAASGVESPLTNEDVVRMTALKLPEAEIVRAVRDAARVEFDLSADIVAEMRLVGVTTGVIDAMEERLAREPRGDSTTRPVEGAIELVFGTQEAPAAGRRQGPPLPRAAFFLVCLDPTHVPDYWTTKTRLSDKFPRHHLLWFHEPPPADDTRKKHRRGAKVTPFPDPALVAIAAGDHALQAGIAIWAPDRTWVPVATAARTVSIVEGETLRLVLSVETHKPPAKEPITVVFVEPAPSDGESPAP